ncbi:MAG: PSD1 domain-containing protein [Planctomycetia bacterium]|nr:PSD1 domain-containing protein [Planctomycetia bacterium]
MLFTWAVALLIPMVAEPADEAVAAAYLKDVRPVLERRCFACHGTVHQKAGLRLDTAKSIRAGGDSGPAVVPKDSQASLMIEKVTEPDPKLRMPPEGEPLTEAEIAALRAWIAAGAAAPEGEKPQKDPRDHWAYRPPVRPAIPASAPDVSNPIDAFLSAKRGSKNLKASPPVSKDLWLRRVAIDLVGLPPTRNELQAFRADRSDEACDVAVDRLLASPAHGERWARHWMDVWRYCDGYGRGEELLFSHHHIWRWRDWIIESLNAGTGYDQMVVAMLAGDEVAPEDPGTLRATGFLARNWELFNRHKWLDTTLEHTSRAFLGVTIQCARCHDHKFDPIAQDDYFRMRAVFEPYQIRIDRVPGQPDRVKDGLVRAFDDFHNTPTHVFIRGDETRPDTNRAVLAGTPAALGGTFAVQPIALPVSAYNPDKKAFVIDEARASADRAAAAASEGHKTARAALEKSVQAQTAAEIAWRQTEEELHSATKPEDQAAARAAAIAATEKRARARRAVIDAPAALHRAEAAQVAAEAARDSLAAVLAVEHLEDKGEKETSPAVWSDAARQAVACQRRQAVADAIVAEIAARQAVEQASTAVDGLIAAATDPKDESLKSALAKATAALVDAHAKLAAAGKQRTAAGAECGQPLSTEYRPRALEFPRAKIAFRDVPSTAPYARTSTGRRLALARWITDNRNPLTARVAVNHIWMRHFGEPLAGSAFDFGLRTPRSVHHELLDWLAVEFMESGWNMKHLHKLIVTSQAYRMQSSPVAADDPNRTIDPDNKYFWRMNPRRMEGEVIRDSLLHLAGRLDSVRGGPALPVAAAEEGLRRTVYYHHARDDRMLFLTMFDAPSVEECYRRHETIVPQQALALSNSKLAFDRADDIARAMSAQVCDDSSADFVVAAFEHLLGRSPTDAERTAAIEGLESLTAIEGTEAAAADAQTAAAKASAAGGTQAPAQSSATRRDRARAAFIHVLLNHNDFVTIR